MTALTWTPQGEFHQGLDRGVLYVPDEFGVAWSGLVAVESIEEDSTTAVTYLDGERFALVKRRGNYHARVEAFMYPAEFERFAGFSLPSLHNRSGFSFSYREWTGAETYRIHLIYNVRAFPEDTDFTSIMGDSDPTMFKWTFSTTPTHMPSALPTAHLVIDSSMVLPELLVQLENMLYGEDAYPEFPSPDLIVDLFEINAIVRVTDNGDGTVTVDGPDEAIQALGNDEYQLSWPSFIRLSEVLYNLSSL